MPRPKTETEMETVTTHSNETFFQRLIHTT